MSIRCEFVGCQKVFVSEVKKSVHVLNKHETVNSVIRGYLCNVDNCQSQFLNDQQFLAHVYELHNTHFNDNFKYSLAVNDDTTSKFLSKFQVTMRKTGPKEWKLIPKKVMDQTKKHLCRFKGCDKSFAGIPNRGKHEYKHYPINSIMNGFVCPVKNCDYGAIQSNNVYQHIIRYHKEFYTDRADIKAKCKEIDFKALIIKGGKLTKTESSWLIFIYDKPFYEYDCGCTQNYLCTDENLIQDHLEKRHDQDSFDKTKLSKHVKTIPLPTYECECHAEYSDRDTLNLHVEDEHNGVPSFIINCCDNKYGDEQSFKNHKMNHLIECKPSINKRAIEQVGSNKRQNRNTE